MDIKPTREEAQKMAERFVKVGSVFTGERKKKWDKSSLLAIAQALLDAYEREEGSPDDLRDSGWSVAVHNDYSQDGWDYTFWLLTKEGRCLKGEGITDAIALNQIRALLHPKESE